MSEVKIEALTPVHIGSGNLLQNNSDFIIEKDGEDSYIHIIDERKILELIGKEHIEDWILNIERRKPTSSLIKRFASSSTVNDYSKQRITCYASDIKPNDTLKEIIHNGMGLPYIPGSSLKGAIRTAILSVYSTNVVNKEDKIYIKRSGVIALDKNGNKQISATIVEKELFGNDPNSDIFRFIRVGDAYFDKDCVIATRMINLNIRNNRNKLKDESKPQLVEAIKTESYSILDINIASEYYNFVKTKFPSVGKMPNALHHIDSLFMLINTHTLNLVEDEINFWKENGNTEIECEDYITELERIYNIIKNCKEGKSCVLRLGHASGWRFITGGWPENLTNFYDVVVPAARPNNHRYMEYDFPKSRRMDEDSELFGFIKLTKL